MIDQQPLASTKRSPLLLAGVCLVSLVYLAWLVHYAEVRRIDGDEGLYTTAARLVWEGKTPYRDFFYQQAPLLPYLYSWIWAVHPRSLLAMRFLSAACGGIAVLLWGVCLLSVKRTSLKVAIATFVAVLLNPYWVSWNVVVKTFAVANLLMSVAAICLYAALHSDRARWYFAGGLALGACTSVRSLYGPLIPFVLAWVLFRERRTAKPPYRKTLALLAGAAFGLLPMIVSFVGDPHAFFFNNVRYHGLQAGYSRLMDGRILVGYRGVGNTLGLYFYSIVLRLLGFHPYFTAEALLALLGGLSLRKLMKRRDPAYTAQDYLYFKLAFVMLVVYTATALVPFPPYDQYFVSPLVPFLVPFLTEGLRVAFLAGRRWVVLLALIAPIFFLGEPNREALAHGPEPEWQLSSYWKVAETVEAHSSPDEVVLSFWPGYVFESGRRYFPGLEDHMVYRITTRIGPEARARYHVASNDQIMHAIETRAVHLLVIGAWMKEFYGNLSPSEIAAFHAAVDANYSLVSKIGDIEVYRRRPS